MNRENAGDLTQRFVKETPGVIGVMLVGKDGEPLHVAAASDVDGHRMAAIVGALVPLAQQTLVEVSRGTLEQAYLKGTDGYVFLFSAGDAGVLVAITAPGAMVGMIFIGLSRLVADLSSFGT